MKSDTFSHSRSESRVYPARLKRSIISWIRHQPILSGLMIFGCTVLLILKFCDLDAYRSVQTVDEALDTSTRLHCEIRCGSMLMPVEQSEEAERTAALHELVKKTQSYNATTTKVALVMSKTRSDDLRWLRDYLQTQ